MTTPLTPPTNPSFTKKRLIFALIALGVLIGGTLMFLLPEPTTFYNVNKKNQVISGYDVVAYFTQGMPAKGTEAYQTNWDGADWLFSSREHLDMFQADPERYAPRYGGYCAWAISARGKRVGIDPDVWAIVDDRLYLNFSKRIGEKWTTEQESHIEQGDIQWTKLYPKI